MKHNLTVGFVVVLCGVLNSLQAQEAWSFERVVRCAATNSPDARIAHQRIRAADADLAQAQAAFFPLLQAQSSYIRTDNPLLVFGAALNQKSFSFGLDFNHVPDADDLNVKGVLSMPLYAGGKLAATRDATKATSKAERHGADAVRNELEFAAARAFHTVSKAQVIVSAAEAEVQALDGSVSVASNRFSTGTLLKSELLDVEVRLAQAQENLVRVRNAATLANRALNNVLGFDGNKITVMADSALPVLPAEQKASGPRPELAALAEQVRAAEAQVRAAKSGYKPQVNAFGSLDYDHGWTFNASGESYTAGVLAHWDLFNGNSTRAKVRKAEAELASAREEARKAELAIGYETDAARLNLKEAEERLLVTEKSVARAEESAQLTRNRFGQGLALASQLMDAESALTGARVHRAEAMADRLIAIAAFRKALGKAQLPETHQ